MVPEPKPKVEKRFEYNGKRKECAIHSANCSIKQEKDNCPRSTEQCQSCGDSTCREKSLRLCVKCLEYIFHSAVKFESMKHLQFFVTCHSVMFCNY